MDVINTPRLPLPDHQPHPESPVPSAKGPRARRGVRGVAARAAREASYLFVDYFLAILAFVVAVTAIAGSAALITLPLFLPAGGIALRALAFAERGLQSSTLGRSIPAPVYASDFPSTGSAAGDLWRRVVDPQTWLEIIWGLVGFVLATVTFVLTVTFGAVAVAGLSAPVWFPILYQVPDYAGVAEAMGLGPNFWLDLGINVAAGGVSVLLFVLAVRLGSLAQSTLAAGLIGSRSTHVRYAALQHAHTAGQEAERDSLRRLERDLHDGPQQGLVRLQMDLARAERLMATDPERAREIIAGAGQTASSTLGELRGLSRGIAPPLLVDRGLRAAVQELAGAHPARVTVRDEIGTRLPEDAETALYFAISEALANGAKHAGAASVEVVLRRGAGCVEAVVTDDGTGGASIAKGHGLAGLQRRLAGVQGTLEVDSPTGGPGAGGRGTMRV